MIKQASTLQLGQIENSIQYAAREAALADGLLCDNNSKNNNNDNDDDYNNDDADDNDNNHNSILKGKGKAALRRGKWTAEEEAYANRLINEFKSGLLPLTDGTTLRTFLSKLLNCDPMRISKKFVGQNCIGKQVFRRRQCDLERLSNEDIEASRTELAELERRFLERVVQNNRTKSNAKDGKNNNNSSSNGNGNGDNSSTSHTIPPWMMPPTDKSNLYDSSFTTSIKESNNSSDGGPTAAKSRAAAKPKVTRGKSSKTSDDNYVKSEYPNDQVSSLARISSVEYIRELVGNSTKPSLNRVNSLELLPSLGFEMTSQSSMDNLQAYGLGMGNPTISSLWPSLNDLAEASKIIAASEEQAENYKKRTSHNEYNHYVADQGNDIGYTIDSSPPLPNGGKKFYGGNSFGSSGKRMRTEGGEQQPIVMPKKNSSVDNFWMLVNSGDIPHPSTSVLSESIMNTQPPQSNGNSNGHVTTN